MHPSEAIMDHLKLIHEFIQERKRIQEIPESGQPFVTISRQAGAGGHLLSYVLLTDFLKLQSAEIFQGWHVFDKQLCEVLAQDPELKDSVSALLKERYRSEAADFLESLFTGRSDQYQLYKATFQVVRSLACIGRVIIVGRGACCVTRDLRAGIHIRLVAPESQRVLWLMKRFKLTRDQASREMRRQDADRRKLLRAFFNKEIDDPLLYDAVWNTGTVGMHEISHSVCEMIRRRAEQSRAAPSPGAPVFATPEMDKR